MTEITRLTTVMTEFLDLMARPDWQETVAAFSAREEALMHAEAALADERAEFAKQKADFKRKLDALMKAEPA